MPVLSVTAPTTLAGASRRRPDELPANHLASCGARASNERWQTRCLEMGKRHDCLRRAGRVGDPGRKSKGCAWDAARRWADAAGRKGHGQPHDGRADIASRRIRNIVRAIWKSARSRPARREVDRAPCARRHPPTAARHPTHSLSTCALDLQLAPPGEGNRGVSPFSRQRVCHLSSEALAPHEAR